MNKLDLKPYVGLLQSFVSGQIDASAFEKKYLRLFKADNRPFSEQEFAILNKLFSDVDMHVPDPGERNSNELDDYQLKECAVEALRALDGLVAG